MPFLQTLFLNIHFQAYLIIKNYQSNKSDHSLETNSIFFIIDQLVWDNPPQTHNADLEKNKQTHKQTNKPKQLSQFTTMDRTDKLA